MQHPGLMLFVSNVSLDPTAHQQWHATQASKENLMKLILETSKPRNPLVAPSLQRKAGSHRKSGGAHRQQAHAALRRELDRLIRPSP